MPQGTPSLCGAFLNSKRGLIAFTWTVTTVLTLLAFVLSIVWVIQINNHYAYLEKYHQQQYDQQQQQEQQQEDEDREEEEHNSADDREYVNEYSYLAHTSSGSMVFCGLYTMMLALGLVLYGSTSIVGFTSLQGDYIAPCLPSDNSQMRLGIFGGAIVMFANLLLLCAVIFGEFRVEDYREENEQGEEEVNTPYAVERMATVLAVTCMFLSVLYATFAFMLFLTYDAATTGESNDVGTAVEMAERHHHAKPLVTLKDRETSTTGERFITIDSSNSA